jgi:hypothetical protein
MGNRSRLWILGVVGLAWLSGREAQAGECSPESWFCEGETEVDPGNTEEEASEDPEEDVVIIIERQEPRPSKKRKRKPAPPPEPAEPQPEVEPEPEVATPCESTPPVVVAARVCGPAAPSPGPSEPQPPGEEGVEEVIGSVGLAISGLFRSVSYVDDRGGALLGGGSIAMRLRPVEEVAFDIGFAAMGGPEDGARGRGEASGFIDLLLYPISGSDVRAYFVVGGEVVGASSSWTAADGTEQSLSHEYVAPRGGLGLEVGGSDWGVFFDGIVAPRFPTNEAAAAELRGEDLRVTVQLRGGLVAFW